MEEQYYILELGRNDQSRKSKKLQPEAVAQLRRAQQQAMQELPGNDATFEWNLSIDVNTYVDVHSYREAERGQRQAPRRHCLS